MSFVKMVEVMRGPLVESVHVGAAAVANARGEIIAGWGDTALVTFPRSALKPVQAMALVTSGACDAWRLTPQHLALACASHRAESFHTALATAWLQSLGLTQQALLCGPEPPADAAAALQAARDGAPAQKIFHNCSGKHCGFLTVARHQGWAIDRYQQLDHPAQQLYLDTLSELLQSDARALPVGIDGCALPAVALSLGAMATAMARFAEGRVGLPRLQGAMRAIHDAMRAHPEYVSGTAQPGVRLAQVTRGRLVLKTGAEGFMLAFVPGEGLAIALKIADGEARARLPALLAVLRATGLLDESELRALGPLAAPPVLNSVGASVGRICPCGFAAARPNDASRVTPHAHEL